MYKPSRPARLSAVRSRSLLKLSCAVGFALGAAAVTPASAAEVTPASAANRPKVATQDGTVKGVIQNGVSVFYGIPYAEPPVGDLRWQPPKRKAPWTTVLDASNYGPICAQVTTLGPFAGPPNANEDCLYLNVFSPNLNPSGKGKLPVIFWIHGGGNFDGASTGYDGTKLAADGHTVVVTINYRLNLMGWLSHPALNKGVFGNYGIMDQQLALKWVQRNIDRFGGDKNNVTVGGQSAGAQDTGMHVISPLSQGLLHRAIYESSVPSTIPTAEIALARGIAMSVAAGCGSGADKATAQCLRNLTPEQVETLAGTQSATSAYITGPFVDGTVITQQPWQAWSNGQFAHIPMMDGRVQDEANFGLANTEYFKDPQVPYTEADFTSYVTTTYSGNAGPVNTPPTYPAGTVDKVLAKYPLYAYASPQLALDAVQTDPSACRDRHYSKILGPQVPYYAYEFDERTAPTYYPKLPGFQFLAYHTSDIQYLFPLWHGGPQGKIHELNKKQAALSDQLVDAWTNFAWTGNPNGQGNNPWPVYKATGSKPVILSQNIPVLTTMTDAQFSAAHKCDFWEKTLIIPD
ncbi:carboxylesterase [Methylocella silvestris]|uniref:Carboxylic ester hydrolase n=1 Tax=Methylocella silvestris TaxID=199596 RepID=A0A2J7TLL5_METSI|nr:carboxylesterase family protein [Methylocella silvestris]PNG27658.1 carboxylesterase [Methylocella silvestris]